MNEWYKEFDWRSNDVNEQILYFRVSMIKNKCTYIEMWLGIYELEVLSNYEEYTNSCNFISRFVCLSFAIEMLELKFSNYRCQLLYKADKR